MELEWGTAITDDGLSECLFVLQRDGAPRVPGILWQPSLRTGGVPALVLVGQGGGSQKRGERTTRIAARLVRDHGVSVVALDGPFHGDRPPPAGVGYQTAVAAEGIEAVVDRVVGEWLDVLALLDDDLTAGGLGYLGMSMGARFGLSLAAELGDRLDVGVLGKYGLEHTGVLHPDLNVPSWTTAIARRVRCPVLFHVEERDEIFHRDSQLALFDLLADSGASASAADLIQRVRRIRGTSLMARVSAG